MRKERYISTIEAGRSKQDLMLERIDRELAEIKEGLYVDYSYPDYLRMLAVNRFYHGNTRGEIARETGYHVFSIKKIVAKYQNYGISGIIRGTKKDKDICRKLSKETIEEIRILLKKKRPVDLGVGDNWFWTPYDVGEYIKKVYGVEMSKVTVQRYFDTTIKQDKLIIGSE